MMMFVKQCLLIASMLWASAECRIGSDVVSIVPGEVQEIRSLQSELERQVIYLLPFDIKIALEGNSSPEDVNIYALKQIVTDWMDASFRAKSENEGLLSNGAAFDYVLLEIANRRELQTEDPARELQTEDPAPTFYKAVFRGFSVWNLATLDTEPVNVELVELIQRATFLEDKSLLELIRNTDSDEFGLGSAVLDVRAEVSDGSTTTGNPAGDDDDDTDETLQLIIMIAIVVACLAFCLLMFAVIWAWRTDRAKREAYKVGRNQTGTAVPDSNESEAPRSPPKQKSPATKAPAPPSTKPVLNLPPREIPAQSDYPESVISDSVAPDSVISNDVDTSFTGYSMPHQQPAAATTPSSTFQPREVNDAASISSMDSYGYSLDGYASSLGPAQAKFPGGALSMPANTTGGGSLGADADESDVDLAPSENGDSYNQP
jgi:hypothetical protein